MKETLIVLVAVSIFFSSCTVNKRAPNSFSFESKTLKIKPISDNVFVHISYLTTNDFGKVACNGMVYFDEGEAVVFDTPTDDNGSKKLINWIEKKRKMRIKAVVVTHFHADCLGGLKRFHDSGVKSYANNATIELAGQNKQKVLPECGFENKVKIKVGENIVFAQFFGEGHTADNVVGHIPSEKVLFGGCLIKSVNAKKGYLGDASLVKWSETVENIKREMPDLKTVIPGHGKNGGVELLDYTIQLFENN